MPELPEVETVARTLSPQIAQRIILDAALLVPKTLEAGQVLWPLLPGARTQGARRRAKVLLIDLMDAHGQALLLAFHLKMTGRLFVHPAETPPHRHTKIVFDLAAAPGEACTSRLFFDDMRTFGYCRLMRPNDVTLWPFWQNLGLEPLEHSPEELANRLALKQGAIKAVLLNQTVLAGIGNIYADESLFRAGIRPDAPTGKLSRQRLQRLASELQSILRQAIQECGSSIRDYRDAHGNAGAFQNNFAVYGRGKECCIHCGRPLSQTRVAGRSTVFCAQCQTT